ncbi:tRNA1(Val) (adenine(37)-N6)-methyltransferase [Acuticoccus kandeliae]|uniref:tRNA1(Val) (adenine(37)-N6)-methyltransferase n=1 Tax=Acuticoccus kandeliae TaxID=2073160 RepID=UPI001300B44A|nr:methyltransferase [Acuticoccus kandeliae]
MSEATSFDSFLGGRFHLLQPRKGVRCGTDAIVLASLVGPEATGTFVDLGTGTGGVAFAAAVRAPGLRGVGVERDAAALALARASLARPENAALAGRLGFIAGDIAEAGTGWQVPGVAMVLMNPPYYSADSGRRSPDPQRDAARALDGEGLAPWLRAARILLGRDGLLGMITPPARLGEVLAGAAPHFGACRVYPVLSRAGQPALRVVLTMRRLSRAPLTLMPPLVMHGAGGGFSPEAARLIAGEATIDEVILAN